MFFGYDAPVFPFTVENFTMSGFQNPKRISPGYLYMEPFGKGIFATREKVKTACDMGTQFRLAQAWCQNDALDFEPFVEFDQRLTTFPTGRQLEANAAGMPGGQGYCILCKYDDMFNGWNRTRVKGYFNKGVWGDEEYTFSPSFGLFYGIKVDITIDADAWIFLWSRTPVIETKIESCKIDGVITSTQRGVTGILFRKNMATTTLQSTTVTVSTNIHTNTGNEYQQYSLFGIDNIDNNIVVKLCTI